MVSGRPEQSNESLSPEGKGISRRALLQKTGWAVPVIVALTIPQDAYACVSPCRNTLSQGYWKNHSNSWPVNTLTVGGRSYSINELIKILETHPKKGDVTYILAHQLIAAKLNVAIGCPPPIVNGTNLIEKADELLREYPLGSRPSKNVKTAMTTLAEKLDDYNNGKPYN